MQLVLRHSWKVFQFTDSLIETPRPPFSLSVQVYIERGGSELMMYADVAGISVTRLTQRFGLAMP